MQKVKIREELNKLNEKSNISDIQKYIKCMLKENNYRIRLCLHPSLKNQYCDFKFDAHQDCHGNTIEPSAGQYAFAG